MNIKISLFIMLVLLGFASNVRAQVDFEHAVGEYLYISSELDTAHLTLNADSTYSYFWVRDNYSGETRGRWIFKRNTIVLNSNIKPPIYADDCKRKTMIHKCKYRYSVLAKKYDSLDYTSIYFKDLNNKPLTNCKTWAVSRKDIFIDTLDQNGMATFNQDCVKSISISMPFAYRMAILKNKGKYNYFEVKLLDLSQEYIYMEDVPLILYQYKEQYYLKQDSVDLRAKDLFIKL